MRPSLAVLAPLVLASLVLVACGSRQGISNQSASVVSSSSLYLRNTFDTDPSIYLGRFVPAGVTELDESNTMVLACSKHISARFIDGGAVAFSEDLKVSAQVAARIGIPVIADASASHEQRRRARADYVLTGKMVAEIADPEAFAACCKAQPDQCTDRFIGEFIQGTGSLRHEAARETRVDVSATNPSNGVSGGGGIGADAEWERVAEFETPVYFAFKVSPTAYSQGIVDTCPSWATDVPKAEGGVYVVGRSNDARSEQWARNLAMNDAQMHAYQAAGLGVDSLGGAPMPVQVESWCVTPVKGGRRDRYNARVLAFVSDASVAEAKTNAAAHREREAAREAAERDAARRDAGSSGGGSVSEPAPAPAPASAASPELERIVAAVEAESMGSDRLSALKLAGRGVRLSADEGRVVLELFTFSGDKMEALRFLRDKISDPQNWSVLVDAFTSSRDREAARALAP